VKPDVSIILAGAVCALALPLSAADLTVGPTKSYQTLTSAVAAARANDRIILEAGVYLDDTPTINIPLTIEGVGDGAILRVTRPISNRKGILVANADLVVRNLILDGAVITEADGKNGAGIRLQAGRLNVENCVFSNNQTGILTNADNGASLTIKGSSFASNGAGDGYTHGIYAGAIAALTVIDSNFSGTRTGHNIKSRARQTTVTNTVLDDGVSGSGSYAVDLPNGGVVILDRLRITQGPGTSNATMIAYGAEGKLYPVSSLTLTNSALINLAGRATGLNNFSAVQALIRDTTFQNISTPLRGSGLIASSTR